MPGHTGKEASGIAPMFVLLGSGDKLTLPSVNYIPVVALHRSGDGKTVKDVFALHHRGARTCKLLEPLLDALDVDLMSNSSGSIELPFPPVTIPQATQAGCISVFRYMELLETRPPSIVSKPLRAPLEELVQSWEMTYLMEHCFGYDSNKATLFTSTEEFLPQVIARGPSALDRLLEVAMISDFLLLESLRDLTCAFVASLGLCAPSEKDLLRLCGLSAPATDSDLAPLYNQYPFLRPSRGE